MTEPVVCIFPHGQAKLTGGGYEEEFTTQDDFRDYISNELPKRETGRYLCRKLGFKDKDLKVRVIPGSLVLFRKKGLIIGKATTKTMFHKFETPKRAKTEKRKEAEYNHEIYFCPESIKVYQKALPIEQIESWEGRKLRQQYYLILRGTRRDFEKAFPDC